jgi:predicted SprT family Zn-dependent metalloprotease
MSPTSELYAPLIAAYDHFNQSLFASELPPVIFTLQRKKNVMGFFAAKRWGNSQGKLCNEISINPGYFASSRLIEVFQTLVHEMVHAWQFHCGHPSDGHYHNKEWAQKMMEVGLMPSDTGEPGGAIVGRHMSDFIMKQGRFMEAANILLKDNTFKLNWVDRLALPKLHEPVVVDSPSLKPNSLVEHCAHDDDLLAASIVSLHDKSLLDPASSHRDEFIHMPESFFIPEVAKRQTRTKYMCGGCSTIIYGKQSLNVVCGDCELPFLRN